MDTFETTIFHAFLVTAAIIGSIIFFFLITLIRLHRKHMALYKSKLDAEITTLEKERTRIAADLHDDLGPLVSAVKFKLNGLEPVLSEEQTLLTDINENLDNIVYRLRSISNGLMPNTLLRKGAMYAIEEYINSVMANTTLKIEWLNYEAPNPPDGKAIHLYRILQEIIHNTAKHAKATKLKIQLYTRNNNFIILTTDNGIGFPAATILKEPAGIGLQNIQSRVELLEGTLQLVSKPGKGTQFLIEFPYTNKNI
ncbi:MAG: sensor histidine kinase [Sphingobacteriales bacterium]|nr:sensor histidine kinase [Sphingobacteriales bacterium]